MDDRLTPKKHSIRVFRIIYALSAIAICAIPFCAIPSPILATIQYNDLSKMIFAPIGVLFVFFRTKNSIRFATFSFLIILALLFSNSLACLGLAISSYVVDVSIPASTIKLAFWLITGVFLPLAGILFAFQIIPSEIILRLSAIPMGLVLLVATLQIGVLLDCDYQIFTDYNLAYYRIFEGYWGSNIDVPSIHSAVSERGRLSATFEEPSLFAQFILLFVIPILLPRIICNENILSYVIDRFMLTFFIVAFALTFSTTGYLVAGIDVALLLFMSISNTKIAPINKIKAIAVIAILMVLVYCFFVDKFTAIALRAFVAGNQSSSSRLGSMVGALHLFAQFPFGVGYSHESKMLYSFLPEWGKTVEMSPELSTIHSALLRIYVQLGILGGTLLLSWGIAILPAKVLLQKASASHRMTAILWGANFAAISIYADVQFSSGWFIFAAAFVIYPYVCGIRKVTT